MCQECDKDNDINKNMLKLPPKKHKHGQYACAQMSAVHLQLMHPILSCKFNHKYEESY